MQKLNPGKLGITYIIPALGALFVPGKWLIDEKRAFMRLIANILFIIVLCACGSPGASSPATAVSLPTQPAATAAPSPTNPPTILPTATALPSPTAAPTATLLAPTQTAKPTALPATIQAAPVGNSKEYRTIATDDGFVSVRSAPSSSSEPISRLKAHTLVQCVGFVKGEKLFGTDLWALCPSVGGYILSALLVDAAAAPPAAEPSSTDAIVRAIHKGIQSPPSSYKISNICIDRNYATAALTLVDGVAESIVALLKRNKGVWKLIFSGPGIALYAPSGREEYGFPEDFKCLGS